MELRNINLKLENFTKGGPAILQNITAFHPYRDGKRVMEEIDGRKVTVVLPDNHYDTLTVTVADPTDALTPLLAKATAANPVYVDFDGFNASIYSMRDKDGTFRTGVSAKASHVRVVDAASINDTLDFGDVTIE